MSAEFEIGSENIFEDIEVNYPITHNIKSTLFAKILSILDKDMPKNSKNKHSSTAISKYLGIHKNYVHHLINGRGEFFKIDRLCVILDKLGYKVKFSVNIVKK